MLKSQGGRFSLVFGTSKDKRNQGTPSHTANWELGSKKVLKYCLTAYYGTHCQQENPLPSPVDGGSS